MGTHPATFSMVYESTSSFDCHLELEVSGGFGIHLFIDEMNIQGDKSVDCPHDYIQFKRDVLAFTTHRSPKFCGIREKENHTRSKDGIGPYSRGGSAQRMYIEEKDFEMDFVIHLEGGVNHPRNISVVVTPFKKFCRANDRTYKQCQHTSYCINRELFCDSRPNCAWPSGDVSDEGSCEEQHEPFFHLSNLPVIIVVMLVLCFIFVIFLMAICHFRDCSSKNREPSVPLLSLTQPQPSSQTQTHPALRHGSQRGPASAPPEPRQNLTIAPFATDFGPKLSEDQPMTPPSYEDAVRHPSRFPPPYSAN